VTIVATGGTAPLSYTFNGETNTTGVFTGVSAGLAQAYSVTDANLCGPVTGAIDVTEPDAIIVTSATVTSAILCNGGTGEVTIVATGGTAPLSYTFNGETNTTGVFTGVSAGLAQAYSVTDANMCGPVTGTIDVTEPDAISVTSATVTSAILCNGGTGEVTIVATGGTAPLSYTFNSETNTTGVFTGVSAGLAQPYSVTDANLCVMATGTIDITEPDPISIIINKVDVAVYGESTGSATAVVSGGTGAYSYEWDTDPVETTDAIIGLAAGTYTVTVTDANGCVNFESIIINQPAPPLSLIITDQINVLCYGDYSGSVTVEGVGGVLPYEYSIDGGAYQSSGLFTGLSEGDYTVEVRDNDGTTASILVSITQPATPLSLSTSQENVLCYGASTGTATVVAAGGTGSYIYLWDTPDAQTTATATGLSEGTYTVSVTDSNGCTAYISVIITQPDQIVATFTTTDVNCNGGSDGTAKVSVTGGTGTYAYLWSTGETVDSIGGLNAGIYTLTIFDDNCSVDVVCEITEPDAILIVPTTTDTRCPDSNDGSITLNITGGTEPFFVYWSDGITTQDRTNVPAGTYNVVVTDSNGCASSADIEVEAGVSPDCIEYPTIITPNNDGHNDEWIIKNIANYPDAELEIFNRWGRRVYRTRNISAEPWDGYYNGSLLPTDSYHYVLNLHDGSDIKTGVITLIR
jgi:gliding motility-associated-like protein